ncbi:MAG TPA: hypothetical protein VGR47_22275 [Terracidiphilus sp.]|nr:hypothetical protein [Terracidiphilus sp.]
MPEDTTQFPIRGVSPIDGIFDKDEEEMRLLQQMAQDAEDYLESFSWCEEIREAYFGGGYGAIVAVFLFRIIPAKPDIDEWLWVVVGDLPPAYLVTDMSKSPSEALASYIREMSRWIQHIKRGHRSMDLIPVDLNKTWENAAALEERLTIMREVIVPEFAAREAVLS